MKKYNQYFKTIRIHEDGSYDVLLCSHIIQDANIWLKIYEKYFNTPEYSEIFNKDPYGSMYRLNLKEYLKNDFPDVYSIIKNGLFFTDNTNIEDSNIEIWLASSEDYRKVDEKFDNELSFLEYMKSEISEVDKNRLITNNILESAGFEKIYDINYDVIKNEYGIDDYVSYRFYTNNIDDKNPIKIDIDNGLTNSDRKWHVHIDNKDCCSIGSAEVDTVYQFNLFMKLFDSKFRL